MNHLRLTALSLAIHLSFSSHSFASDKEDVAYDAQLAEKRMLHRSFAIHLRPFENDWTEIKKKNQGYFYGLYENGARDDYLERSKKINDIFNEIFFDEDNPDPEQEKIVADLKAKMMLRHYYNQQCKSILKAYPNSYSTFFSYTPSELHLIFTLETLAIKLQEYMLEQLETIRSTGIEIDEKIETAIKAPPLHHNYHDLFDKQLKELQTVGKASYLKNCQEQEIEQKRLREEKRQEERRLAMERKKENIPMPPPLPSGLSTATPSKPSLQGREALMSNLSQVLSTKRTQLNTVKVNETLSPKPSQRNLTKTNSSLPFLDELRKVGANPRALLKPAGDRVLEKMVKKEDSELFRFFNESMITRRQAIHPSEHQESEKGVLDDFED